MSGFYMFVKKQEAIDFPQETLILKVDFPQKRKRVLETNRFKWYLRSMMAVKSESMPYRRSV